MRPDKEHDAVIGKSNATIAKVDADHPRPHADGCVGCRREGTCTACGGVALLGAGRCISGIIYWNSERLDSPPSMTSWYSTFPLLYVVTRDPRRCRMCGTNDVRWVQILGGVGGEVVAEACDSCYQTIIAKDPEAA